MHIENFLKQIRDRFQKQGINRLQISEILTSFLGRKIKEESITFKNGVLNIQEKPIVKSALFLKKEQIISVIEKETGIKIKDLK